MLKGFFYLPVQEIGLPVPSMAKTAHPQLGEDQWQLARHVLEPRQVHAEVAALVQVDVEGENVNEREFQVFGGGEIGVGDKALGVLLLSDVIELPQKGFHFSRAMPPNDRGRDLLPHAVHQDGRVAPAGCHAFFNLAQHLFSDARLLQETDVLHPWHECDDSEVILLGLIQEGNRGNCVCQDRIDPSRAHEHKILLHVSGLRELVPLAIGREGAIGDSLDEELVVAQEQKFAFYAWPTRPANSWRVRREDCAGHGCLGSPLKPYLFPWLPRLPQKHSPYESPRVYLRLASSRCARQWRSRRVLPQGCL